MIICYTVSMNGKEASLLLGVTYRQLDYMLKQVENLVLVRYSESRGKARDIGPHDLTRLWLAFALKADGYNTAETQKAIDILNANWNGEVPKEAGVLLALGDGDIFRWASDINFTIGYGKDTTPMTIYKSLPRMFYNVRKVANDIYDNSY